MRYSFRCRTIIAERSGGRRASRRWRGVQRRAVEAPARRSGARGERGPRTIALPRDSARYLFRVRAARTDRRPGPVEECSPASRRTDRRPARYARERRPFWTDLQIAVSSSTRSAGRRRCSRDSSLAPRRDVGEIKRSGRPPSGRPRPAETGFVVHRACAPVESRSSDGPSSRRPIPPADPPRWPPRLSRRHRGTLLLQAESGRRSRWCIGRSRAAPCQSLVQDCRHVVAATVEVVVHEDTCQLQSNW